MHRHPVVPALVLSALAAAVGPAPLVAQSGFAAHIPSDTPATGTCSAVPMGGFFAESQFRSQRTQIVVTAAELGQAPRTIHNLAFAPCGSGLRTYGRLIINMSHHTGPLSATFDDNFVGRETKLLDRRGYEWPNTAGQWANIGLTQPFAYDPTQGDLLVEIIARNSDFTGADPTMRADQRPVVHACCFSPTPRTGTLTNTSAKLRLSDSRGYIDSFGQGCGTGPLSLDVTGTPNLGGRIDLAMTGGNPSAQPTLGGVLMGATPGGFSLDQFCYVYFRSVFALRLPVQGGTSPTLSLPMPTSPALVGGKFYLQGVNYDPAATTFGFATSQYVVITLGL
ncbi:MAG: hypothetical protein AAF628_19100 [Planctomycetota bacterium]